MVGRALAWWLAAALGAACARELDPAACAPRFDVQRDKIIRTEESRDMGARYLSELDVGARRECLRLCCETDSCDVFVYEEKGPGSCYLFNCGPPEDFRCKFTTHSNFSSGVLALSRRLAELQDQERLAHHEQELSNLRSVASSSPPPPPSATTVPPPRHTTHSLRPPSRCSRYQFECRVGGECIAVYNACDGVPQCADGSDEAPELGCPRAPPAPPAHPAPPAPVATHPTHTPTQESMDSGATGNGEAAGADAVAPERWPHRLAQAQPQHRYDEGAGSSHIFSHKGGLLQEPESNALGAQYPPFEPPWPRRSWPQQAGMEGSSSERGWGGGPYARLDWPEPDPRRAWPVPQPPPDQELPAYTGGKTTPEETAAYAGAAQTLRDAPKKGLQPAPRSPAPPRAAPDDTRGAVAAEPDAKVVERVQPQPSVAGPQREAQREAQAAHAPLSAGAERARDGPAEHPPAAVLLLVLGVLMSAVMCGMAGCRARAARRRLRRGKSPFAHDADYLVNGMYL